VKETLTYDKEDHQWWRFRDEGSSLHFETSPDGGDWTSRHNIATPQYIGDVTVGLGVVPAPTISMEAEAQFDNLDLLPWSSSMIEGWLRAQLQATRSAWRSALPSTSRRTPR
jgi:hypothetical protein